VAGGWRRLHEEELHNLYSSPSIRVIKSRDVRWIGHVAHMREMNHTKFWSQNLKARGNSEDLGVDGRYE